MSRSISRLRIARRRRRTRARGKVVEEFHSLIRPPEDHDEFEPGNVRVHGIRSSDVTHAPRWRELYPQLRDFIDDDVVVGHNAAFDTSVLLNMCGAYDIDWPVLNVVCTLRLAPAALRLPSYSCRGSRSTSMYRPSITTTRWRTRARQPGSYLHWPREYPRARSTN